MNADVIKPVQSYAENAATFGGHFNAPDVDVMSRGVEPLDTLPAAWWNWLWNKITEANIVNSDALNDLRTEIKNAIALHLVDDGSGNMIPSIPDKTSQTQLRDAIQYLVTDRFTTLEASTTLAITALEDVVRQLTIEVHDADAQLQVNIESLTHKHDTDIADLRTLIQGLKDLHTAELAAHAAIVGTDSVAGHLQIANNLEGGSASTALAAAQGVIIDQRLRELSDRLEGFIGGTLAQGARVVFDDYNSALRFMVESAETHMLFVDLARHPLNIAAGYYKVMITIGGISQSPFVGTIIVDVDDTMDDVKKKFEDKMNELLYEGYTCKVLADDTVVLTAARDLLLPEFTWTFEGQVTDTDTTADPLVADNIFKQPVVQMILNLVKQPFAETVGIKNLDWKMNGLPYQIQVEITEDDFDVDGKVKEDTVAAKTVAGLQEWFDQVDPGSQTVAYDAVKHCLTVTTIPTSVPPVWEFDSSDIVPANLLRQPYHIVVIDFDEHPLEFEILGTRDLRLQYTLGSDPSTIVMTTLHIDVTVADDMETLMYKILSQLVPLITPTEDYAFSWDPDENQLQLVVAPAGYVPFLELDYGAYPDVIFKQPKTYDLFDTTVYPMYDIAADATEDKTYHYWMIVDNMAYSDEIVLHPGDDVYQVATDTFTAKLNTLFDNTLYSFAYNSPTYQITVQPTGVKPTITFDYFDENIQDNIFKQPYDSTILDINEHEIITDITGTYSINVTISGTAYTSNTVAIQGKMDVKRVAEQVVTLLNSWLPVDQQCYFNEEQRRINLVVPVLQTPVPVVWNYETSSIFRVMYPYLDLYDAKADRWINDVKIDGLEHLIVPTIAYTDQIQCYMRSKVVGKYSDIWHLISYHTAPSPYVPGMDAYTYLPLSYGWLNSSGGVIASTQILDGIEPEERRCVCVQNMTAATYQLVITVDKEEPKNTWLNLQTSLPIIEYKDNIQPYVSVWAHPITSLIKNNYTFTYKLGDISYTATIERSLVDTDEDMYNKLASVINTQLQQLTTYHDRTDLCKYYPQYKLLIVHPDCAYILVIDYTTDLWIQDTPVVLYDTHNKPELVIPFNAGTTQTYHSYRAQFVPDTDPTIWSCPQQTWDADATQDEMKATLLSVFQGSYKIGNLHWDGDNIVATVDNAHRFLLTDINSYFGILYPASLYLPTVFLTNLVANQAMDSLAADGTTEKAWFTVTIQNTTVIEYHKIREQDILDDRITLRAQQQADNSCRTFLITAEGEIIDLLEKRINTLKAVDCNIFPHGSSLIIGFDPTKVSLLDASVKYYKGKMLWYCKEFVVYDTHNDPALYLPREAGTTQKYVVSFSAFAVSTAWNQQELSVTYDAAATDPEMKEQLLQAYKTYFNQYVACELKWDGENIIGILPYDYIRPAEYYDCGQVVLNIVPPMSLYLPGIVVTNNGGKVKLSEDISFVAADEVTPQAYFIYNMYANYYYTCHWLQPEEVAEDKQTTTMNFYPYASYYVVCVKVVGAKNIMRMRQRTHIIKKETVRVGASEVCILGGIDPRQVSCNAFAPISPGQATGYLDVFA